MGRFGKFVRLGTAGAVALAIALTASSASADLAKCQKKIAGIANKYMVTCTKGIQKCLDASRKGIVKGAPASKTAIACEKALAKVFDYGNALGGKAALSKSVVKLQVLDDGGPDAVCQPEDLEQLGHLISGTSAPGGQNIDWMTTWLLKAKEMLCLKEELFDIGDARQLLNTAINAGPDDGDPLNCDPAGGKGCGTDCTGTPPAGEFFRPNVCAYRAPLEPECNTHACALSGASGGGLQPLGVPIALSGRRTAIEVCKQRAPSYPVSGTDFTVIVNQPARTLQPPPVLPLVPAITVCVQQIRSEGWCDNAAAAPSSNTSPSFCLDHIADPGGTCPDDGAALETNCVCGFPLVNFGQACNSAGCLACVNGDTGAPCHSGTQTSEVTITWGGPASVAGDCVDLNTIQFTLEPPAICIDAMNNALGQCNAPGSPPASCTALGGVFCAPSSGADGVNCTADDIIPAGAPTSVPFTTKNATSTIEDMVATQGVCAAGQIGMNCVTDPDCDTTAGGDGVCAGAVFGCGTGPNPEDCQFTSGPGTTISAALMESSNISGWSIVGSFPALDGAGGIGDAVTTFTLACS